MQSAYATLYGFVINGINAVAFSLFSRRFRPNLKTSLNYYSISINFDQIRVLSEQNFKSRVSHRSAR